VEAPIHHEEIARRVSSLWGLKRKGSRIVEAVASALQYLVRGAQVFAQGPIYRLTGGVPVRVRVRTLVKSAAFRKPEFLAPVEVREAAVSIIRDNPGATADAVVQEGARRLGWKATSEALRDLFETELREIVREGTCVLQSERLYINDAQAAAQA
jgi:hypothetical protein